MNAREKVVVEARRLFAANGYQATTVAHIQVACGLTPGSGALYKHFPSKYALLCAVAASFAAAPFDPGATVSAAPDPALSRASDEVSTVASLRRLGEGVLSRLLAQQGLLRFLLRDLDEAPDLLEPLWARYERGAVDPLLAWIDARRPGGSLYCADPRATATILGAALTHTAALIALTGRGPGGTDADGFLHTWVAHAAGAFGLQPVSTSGAGSVPAAQLSLMDL